VLDRTAARPAGLYDVQLLSYTADNLDLNSVSLVSSCCTQVLSKPTPSAALSTADADRHSPIVGDARGDLRHAIKGAKDKTPALVCWRHSQQDNDDD